MRSILLPLAMLAVCAAAPVAVAVASPTPAAPPAAAASSSSHYSFFIEDVHPDDILSYDTRVSVLDARMRAAALPAPITVITTTPITTTPVTTTPVTTVPVVDLDSDGSPAGVDCNDNNNSIYPGALESIADGVDQDCDGYDACYEDLDHDSFGSSNLVDALACSGVGFSSNSSDCVDSGTVTGTGGAINAQEINPDAIEACDGVDNDCDNLIDDADPNHEGESFYADGDGDGYGAGTATVSCIAPPGTVADNTDCDDANNTINPGAEDIDTNGIDDNCDSVVDGTAVDDTDTIGGGGDTDDVADTSDRGVGTDKGGAACKCDTSAAPSPAGIALALSFVGSLLARRRKV